MGVGKSQCGSYGEAGWMGRGEPSVGTTRHMTGVHKARGSERKPKGKWGVVGSKMQRIKMRRGAGHQQAEAAPIF